VEGQGDTGEGSAAVHQGYARLSRPLWLSAMGFGRSSSSSFRSNSNSNSNSSSKGKGRGKCKSSRRGRYQSEPLGGEGGGVGLGSQQQAAHTPQSTAALTYEPVSPLWYQPPVQPPLTLGPQYPWPPPGSLWQWSLAPPSPLSARLNPLSHSPSLPLPLSLPHPGPLSGSGSSGSGAHRDCPLVYPTPLTLTLAQTLCLGQSLGQTGLKQGQCQRLLKERVVRTQARAGRWGEWQRVWRRGRKRGGQWGIPKRLPRASPASAPD